MTEDEARRKKIEECCVDQERRKKLPRNEEEAKKKYLKFCSRDPFPNIKAALLNSADIFNYVATTGMIYPFYPEQLSGASYSVGIGEKVIWWDEERQERHEENLSKSGAYFKLRPNSIAFVMLEPLFQIPDYLVLRFNLRVVHVYKGLLLGTGPIVDPGFVGKLSIPLHNLTANTYTFRRGDALIALEFTKMSDNPAWKNERTPETIMDNFYKKTWITPNRSLENYIDRALEGNVMIKCSIPDDLKQVRSMAEQVQEELTSTKKDVEKSLQGFQIAAVLSIIPVLVFACTAIYQLGTANTIKKEQIYDLQEQYEEIIEKYDELNRQNQIYWEALKTLGIDVDEMKEKLKEAGLLEEVEENGNAEKD